MTYEQIMKANAEIRTTDIKGKDYAEVNQRIKAFRMLYPDGTILTSLESLENGICVIKATVMDDLGKVLGTGHAYEKEGSTFINKTSYIENCETSAVGRALGMCGIGIDTSVASYEEVQNAIVQQEEEKAQNVLVDQAKMTVLIETSHKKGVEIGKILERYGINHLEEMTVGDWMKAMSALKKTKDV